jgi:hypothetical protein
MSRHAMREVVQSQYACVCAHFSNSSPEGTVLGFAFQSLNQMGATYVSANR